MFVLVAVPDVNVIAIETAGLIRAVGGGESCGDDVFVDGTRRQHNHNDTRCA